MNEQYVDERIEQYKADRKLFEEFSEQVLKILTLIIKDQCPNVKIASYSCRAKEVESLKKKLLKDKYNRDSEITDLAGVRIIAYSRRDIDLIKDIIISNFEVDKEKSTDKTQDLGRDKVGYRGNHYVVLLGKDRSKLQEYQRYKDLKCEIQVTSLIAHTWSEITHEKGYKSEGNLPIELERRKNLLAGLLELADLEMDSYVEAYDEYVAKLQSEIEEGGLKCPINSTSLEKYMGWKFPNINPQIFRDVDLVLHELKAFGLDNIEQLHNLMSPDFVKEISASQWRSLDGIIRNILIISDAHKYFDTVWNPAMNQMNKKNYDLYVKFGIDIGKICEEKNICIV